MSYILQPNCHHIQNFIKISPYTALITQKTQFEGILGHCGDYANKS